MMRLWGWIAAAAALAPRAEAFDYVANTIDPTVTLAYDTHAAYEVRITVTSDKGAPDVGPATYSQAFVVMRGAEVDTYEDSAVGDNCTATQTSEPDVITLECEVWAFPTVIAFSLQAATSSHSVMAGYRYNGPYHGVEIGCVPASRADACANEWPLVERVAGCFQAGGLTFGCNPFLDPVLTVRSTNVDPAAVKTIYIKRNASDVGTDVCPLTTGAAWAGYTTEAFAASYGMQKAECQSEAFAPLRLEGGYTASTFEVIVRQNTDDYTSAVFQASSARLHFGPAVTGAYVNASYPKEPGSEETVTGTGSCEVETAFNAENPYFPTVYLRCIRPEQLRVTLEGWALDQLCPDGNFVGCTPVVEILGVEAPFLPATTFYDMTAGTYRFVLTSQWNIRGTEDLSLTLRSAQGMRAYSVVNVAVEHPPTLLDWNCSTTNAARPGCEIPGNFTFWGDGFYPNGDGGYIASLEFHPVYNDSIPVENQTRPVEKIPCMMHYETSFKYTCVVEDALRGDMGYSASGGYGTHVSMLGGWNYSLSFVTGGINVENTTGLALLWSPPLVDRVDGCQDTATGSTTENCDSTELITLTGARFPTNAVVRLDGEACETTTWIDENTLTCQPVYRTRAFPEVRTVTIKVDETVYNFTHTVMFDTTPEVFSVSGCIDDGDWTSYCPSLAGFRSLNRTAEEETVLKITGRGFYGVGSVRVWFGDYPCLHVRVVHDAELLCLKWNVSQHNPALQLPLSVQRGLDEPKSTTDEVYIQFNPLPYVTAVQGCDVVGDGLVTRGAFNCSPGALNTPITIVGGNFEYLLRAVAVNFGEYPCDDVDVVSGTEIVCRAYPSLKGTKPTRVTVGSETSPVSNTSSHYVVPVGVACPTVNGRVCNGQGHCDAGTGWCICTHDNWDRRLGCGQCMAHYWGDQCQHHCSCDYMSGGICDDGVDGTGLCVDCHAEYWGATCVRCPAPSPSEPVCSGRGVCDDGVAGTGACTCSPLGMGWQEDCSDCAKGWWGLNCSMPCLGGGNCNGHGTCDPRLDDPNYRLIMLNYRRRTHDGSCYCDPEWAGANCSQTCPTGPGHAACYGHGSCSHAVCTCHNDTAHGHWAGAACNECGYGWSGDDCLTACPLGADGLVCGGNGACSDGECRCGSGYCGATCELLNNDCASSAYTCTSPYAYGSLCQSLCPGTDVDAETVCSGNGVCDAGKAGSGICSCKQPWRGAACDVDCSRCVGGSCTYDGACVCEFGYAGAWCDKPCPSTGAGWCAGHGSCDWGGTASGACTCEAGYAGLSCDTECAGGWELPCSSHGECRSFDGGCDCYDEGRLGSAGRGSWAGIACDVCKPPYVAPHCNETCPGLLADERTVCSGHGECDDAALVCYCTRLNDAGHWDGAACDGCAEGYYGETCTAMCPGGSCDPSSGHGVCDDGRSGSGLCKCASDAASGRWAGAECADCRTGWFGVECKLECPGLSGETACSGHGECDAGRSGTGVCSCLDDPSPQGSHYAGADCSTCAPGYFGTACSQRCPIDVLGQPCSGHGQCDEGILGSGFCSCDEGWTGTACGARCPATASGVCHGRGACLLVAGDAAECVCDSTRFDVTTHCEACEGGWWGDDCETRCPGPADLPCNGRSSVAAGSCDQSTGACDCIAGWGGRACDAACPGPVGAPCGGHGVCGTNADTDLAFCSCAASTTTGYWQGASCEECHPAYTGVGCTIPCPLSGNAICGGRGTCFRPAQADAGAGVCSCDAGYCGPACEYSDRETCQRFDCPTGYGSPTCAVRCPACVEGQGVCDSGTLGSGECLCDHGFGGTDCSVAIDCTQCVNGFCDATLSGDGLPSCACHDGWAGRWCDIECGGGWRTPCGGFGICAEGNDGDGTCTCDDGWRGTDCSLACPLNPAYPDNPVCSGHGFCVQSDLVAAASPCTCEYRWAGSTCEVCEDGWSGDDCTTPCVHGTTDGHLCACDFGWLGDGCVKACPGGLVVADPTSPSGQRTVQTCTGHGSCSASSHNCTCDATYFGEDCSTYCHEPVTCSDFVQRAVVCSAQGCQCAQSPELGYWSGKTCDACADGYWGDSCLAQCSCSGNAYRCEQHTGACHCFADDVKGYWREPDCEVCDKGYTGVDCTEAETAYAIVGGTEAIFSPKFEHMDTAFILLDEVNGRVVVAATPPAVYKYGAGKDAEGGAALEFDPALTANLAGWEGRILTMEFSTSGEYILAVNEIAPEVHELLKILRSGLIILHTFPLDPSGVTIGGRAADALESAAAPPRRAARSLASTHEHAASVILAGMLYTVYYVPADGTATLHVTEISERGETLRLLARYSLEGYVTHVQNAITWVNALRQNYLLLSGVDGAGKNVLVAAQLEDGGTRVSLRTVPVDLGTTSTHTLVLANTFSTQYWYATLKHVSGGLHKLELVRVDLSRATESSSASAAGVLETRPIYSSSKDFAPQTLSITQSPPAGQLVIRHAQSGGEVEPSLLFSFDPEGLAVTRNMKFGSFAGTPEDVVDIVTIPSLRMSVALPDAPFLRLVQLNTFAVTDVTPKVIDISGDVTVIVTGTGFAGTEAYCRFIGRTMRAYNVNATAVWCDIPKLEQVYTEGSCGGHPIEVSFYGTDRFTSNGVELTLVSSATVVALTPTYGLIADLEAATKQQMFFEGYGFIASSSTTCQLENKGNGVVIAGKAYVQNASHVVCELRYKKGDLKVANTPYVPSVSQNGAYYPETQAGFGFVVVGDPAGLFMTSAVTTVAMNSAKQTPLPALDIYTVDEAGNRLLDYSGTAQPELAVAVAPTVVCTNASHSTPYPLLRNGGGLSGLFMKSFLRVEGLYLTKVTGGDCVVKVEGTSAASGVVWRAEFVVTVKPGDLAELQIVSRLKRTVDDDRVPLHIVGYNHPEMLGPVVLRGRDAGGNFVTLARRDILEVAVVEGAMGSGSNKTVHTALVAPDLAGLEWVVVFYVQKEMVVYGKTYHLRFRTLNVRSGVPAVVDGPIIKRPCGESLGSANPEYAVLGSADCKPCPTGAKCDGSHRVFIESGWWREPSVMYDEGVFSDRLEEVYTNVLRCPNPEACKGGLTSNCSEGYRGPLCQSCAVGHARQGDDCVKCFDSTVATQLVVVFVVLFAMLVVFAVVYRVLSESALGRRNVIFVFIKLLVNYFQMLAAVVGDENVQWPSVIRLLLSAQRKILNLHLSFAPFGCVAELDVYEIFLVMVCVPAMWACFLATVYPVMKAVGMCILHRRARRQREVEDIENGAPGTPSPTNKIEFDMDGGFSINLKAAPAVPDSPDSTPGSTPRGEAPLPAAGAGDNDSAANQSCADDAAEAPDAEDEGFAAELEGFTAFGSPQATPMGESEPVPREDAPAAAAASPGAASIPAINLQVASPLAVAADAAAPPSPTNAFEGGAHAEVLSDNGSSPGPHRPSVSFVDADGRLSSPRASQRGSNASDPGRERAREKARRASQRQVRSSIRRLSKMEDPGKSSVGSEGGRPRPSFVDLEEASPGDAPRRASVGPAGVLRAPRGRRRSSMGVTKQQEKPKPTARRFSSAATTKLGVGAAMRRKISAAGHAELVIDTDSEDDDGSFGAEARPPALVMNTGDWIREQQTSPAVPAIASMNSTMQMQSMRFAGQIQKVVHTRARIASVARKARVSSAYVPTGRFVIADFMATLAGTASRDTEVICHPPPDFMVRLIPENPTLSFAPRALVFTPEQPKAHVTVYSDVPGTFKIRWRASGLGKGCYLPPAPSEITFDSTVRITVWDIVLTAWFVVFYLFHPVMVLFSGYLVDCVEVNGREYLIIDVSKECGTDEWWKWQYVNGAALGIYGVVVPALLVAYIRRQLAASGTGTDHAVSFFISGYRAKCWYWDFVVMVRKCALIAISVFEKKLLYRLFLSQVVILVSILLNLYIRPLARAPHHHAETTSLFAIFAIVNLGLYYFRDDLLLNESEGNHVASDPMLAIVYGALVLANVLVFVSFIVLYIYLYKHRLVEEGRHGLVEWVDISQDRDIRTLTLWETVKVIFCRIFGLKVGAIKQHVASEKRRMRKHSKMMRRRAKRVGRLRKQILGKTAVEQDDLKQKEHGYDNHEDATHDMSTASSDGSLCTPPHERDGDNKSEDELQDPSAVLQAREVMDLTDIWLPAEDTAAEAAALPMDMADAAPAPPAPTPDSPRAARAALAEAHGLPTSSNHMLVEQLKKAEKRPQPSAGGARPQPTSAAGARPQAGMGGDESSEEEAGEATTALRNELHHGWRKAYTAIMKEKWDNSEEAGEKKLSFERAVALGVTQDPDDPSINFEIFLGMWMKQRQEEEKRMGIGSSLGALGQRAPLRPVLPTAPAPPPSANPHAPVHINASYEHVTSKIDTGLKKKK